MRWQDEAACRGREVELFYPPGGSTEQGRLNDERSRRIRRAKAICAGCPVIQECGDWAFENNDQFAILGGMTAEERAAIKRRKTRNKVAVA